MKQSTKTKLDERRPEVANDAHKGWTQAAIARHMTERNAIELTPLRSAFPRRCDDVAVPKVPFCATRDLTLKTYVSHCCVRGCLISPLLADLRRTVCGCCWSCDLSDVAAEGCNAGGTLMLESRFFKTLLKSATPQCARRCLGVLTFIDPVIARALSPSTPEGANARQSLDGRAFQGGAWEGGVKRRSGTLAKRQDAACTVSQTRGFLRNPPALARH